MFLKMSYILLKLKLIILIVRKTGDYEFNLRRQRKRNKSRPLFMLFIVSLNFLLFDVGNTLEMHWTTDLFRIWYNFYIRAAEHAFDSALKVWMN